jgi:hypothetical protein
MKRCVETVFSDETVHQVASLEIFGLESMPSQVSAISDIPNFMERADNLVS